MIALTFLIIGLITILVGYAKYGSIEEYIFVKPVLSYFSFISFIMGFVLFLVFVIATPIQTNKLIQQKKSILTTIETSNRNSIENASLINNVLQFNKTLKMMKYYNNFWIWDIYYPDYIENVKPIELDETNKHH